MNQHLQNMHPPRMYLSSPHMGGTEESYIHEAFVTNWISPVGPNITAFESELCAITGATHAVALSSGTSAIHLALILAGVGVGDDVFCSTFTFSASANPIVYCGANPVFIDSTVQTWNMDPELFAKALAESKRNGKIPKACIVVNLYGQSADLDPIIALCKENGIVLIEDAAESLGATYKGSASGTLGDFGIYSFNGNKIITTSGGGMLVSENKDAIEKARFLSTQARDNAPHYEHTHIGYNYRMSNICAGIGRGQLKVLADRVSQRRANATWYQEKLVGIPGLNFMPEAPYGMSNRWLTCITLDPAACAGTPEDIRLALEAHNIESRPLWKPMHMQPIFKNCKVYTNGISEKLFENGLCLPSGSNLTKKDLERVALVCTTILTR